MSEFDFGGRQLGFEPLCCARFEVAVGCGERLEGGVRHFIYAIA